MHKLFQKKSRILCLTLALALAFCTLPAAVFAETDDEGIDSAAAVLTSTETISSKKRAAGDITGAPLVTVTSGETITVNGTLDGNREEVPSSSGPLVEVQQGGTLILDSGAVLCNNADTAIVSHGGEVIVNSGAKIYNCGSLSKKTMSAATKTEYRLSEKCNLYNTVAEPLKGANQSKYLQGSMNSRDYINSVLADWADNLDQAKKAYDAKDSYDNVNGYAKKTKEAYEILKRFTYGLSPDKTKDQTDFGPWVLSAMMYWDPYDGSIPYCEKEYNDWQSDNNFVSRPFGMVGKGDYSGIALYQIPNTIEHVVIINAGDPIESLDAEETRGGAIYADQGSTVTINGGKIGGDSEIEDSDYNELDRFENGNVAAFGGAIYIEGSSEDAKSTLTINDGEFTYNDTYHGKDNAWSDATVSSLSETGFGGAIYAGEYTNVTITGGSFTHNRAHSGGVLYLADGATATIGKENGGEEGPLLDSNTCTFGNGGAIAVAGGKLTMKSGKLHNNQANWPEIGTNNTQANGGGVALTENGSIFNLEGGLITKNISVDNGGGIALLNDTSNEFNMIGGTLKDNTSPNAPGPDDSVIDSTARGAEVYVGSGNKQITLSGGEIINSDITGTSSDNAALYLNNALSSDDTNFLKLDGVKLEGGVIYLTKKNTVSIIATERCPEDIKLKFHLSPDYVPTSVVVDVKTAGGNAEADKALADKLLGNATIINPTYTDGSGKEVKRIVARDANNDIWIYIATDYAKATIHEQGKTDYLKGANGGNKVLTYDGTASQFPDPLLTFDYEIKPEWITWTYGNIGADSTVSPQSADYSSEKPKDAGYYYVRAYIHEPGVNGGQDKVGEVHFGPFCIQSKPITVTIDNRSSTTSSSSLAALTWKITDGSPATGDTKESLGINLKTDAVPSQAGTYKILPGDESNGWTNKNYNVTFLPVGGATYTIKKAPSYSGGSSHTTSPDVIERNDFLEKHEIILKADVNKITLNDEAKVLAALKDYDALSKDAQYLLGEEHDKLLTFKARVDALRAEEAARAETNKPAPSKNPTTGDFTGLTLPMVLALAGIGLFGVSALARKRRDNR